MAWSELLMFVQLANRDQRAGFRSVSGCRLIGSSHGLVGAGREKERKEGSRPREEV